MENYVTTYLAEQFPLICRVRLEFIWLHPVPTGWTLSEGATRSVEKYPVKTGWGIRRTAGYFYKQ